MTNEQNTDLPAGIERDSQRHVDWLMIPRVQVIAPWPGMPNGYKAGLVLSITIEDGCYFYKGDEIETQICEAALHEIYPHLFRPLNWGEHRSPEQMPGYVKYKDVIYELQIYPAPFISWQEVTPATRLEYEQFLNAGNGTK